MSPGPARPLRAEAINMARRRERAEFAESVDRIEAELRDKRAAEEHAKEIERERERLRDEYKTAVANHAETTTAWVRELLAIAERFPEVVATHNAARKIREQLVRLGEQAAFPQPYWGYEERHWSDAVREIAHALDRDSMRPSADSIGRYAYDLVRRKEPDEQTGW